MGGEKRRRVHSKDGVKVERERQTGEGRGGEREIERHTEINRMTER